MDKLYSFIIAGFFVFILLNAKAQTPKYRVVSIPVERNNAQLRSPWVGGLNSPQFSSCDLNHDGIKDLFIFDRFGDKVITYLSSGDGTDTMLTYAPQYEELFPSDLSSWVLMRDYNNDGIPDIFTHATGGTKVYKGSWENGALSFTLVNSLLSYLSPPDPDINIWTNIADIPVIADVNHDGDLDVLTYGIFGATVEYYENQTKEHSGDAHYNVDSFKYELITQCWGNFSQNSLSNSINLNQSCKGGGQTNPEGGDQRHSGNSIYNFDNGNDGDVDLLNGNIGYDNLLLLNNCGDSSYANICQWDSVYPSCNSPIIMPTYPAAFGFDVNNDDFEDLLVSPNVNASGRDVHNVMYYKNENNQLCNFQFQSDSFLVGDMLDFGTDSKALFFDGNGDGLKDLIVGNYGYFRPFQTYLSTLAYYENFGSATHPKFRKRDEDYNNLSSYQLVAVDPAFGDLDGDGKPDLVIGELNGYVHFFKNMGTSIATFPSMTTPQLGGIRVGQYSAPFIYDVNGDSLPDLIIGKKDGKLAYYWNFGTRNNPQFSQDSVNPTFGGVNVTVPGYTEGYSQPYIIHENGQMKLFVGSLRGAVFEYVIDPNKLLAGNFALLDSDFLKHDVGSKATVAIADLNNDGKMEYVVGNSRGGLLMYSDSVWDPELELGIEELNDKEHLHIYPNPAREYFTCSLEQHNFVQPVTVVYNVVGQKVNVETQVSGSHMDIYTATLANGFYIVRITDAGKTYTGKVLIER